MVDIIQATNLSLEKHSAIRRLQALEDSNQKDSQEYQTLLERLSKIDNELKQKNSSYIEEKTKQIIKLEEMKMAANPDVKAKLKKLNDVYNGKIQTYRELVEQVNVVRKEKEEMRKVREKLYALKEKDSLTAEESTFVNSI